eukprot:4905565-Pyramimonas_sp.AAC.1
MASYMHNRTVPPQHLHGPQDHHVRVPHQVVLTQIWQVLRHSHLQKLLKVPPGPRIAKVLIVSLLFSVRLSKVAAHMRVGKVWKDCILDHALHARSHPGEGLTSFVVGSYDQNATRLQVTVDAIQHMSRYAGWLQRGNDDIQVAVGVGSLLEVWIVKFVQFG